MLVIERPHCKQKANGRSGPQAEGPTILNSTPATATLSPTAKLPVSAVFITLNAAHQLEDALRSVQTCDDIVVVDSGSTDGTPELAARYGARVFQQPWMGFGPQKQHAVEQAKHDWVLCLDADERVTPALQAQLLSLFNAGPANLPTTLAGFEMPRCNWFLGRPLRHGEGYPDYSKRLFHRQRARWSNDAVHEKVECNPGLHFQRIPGDLEHRSADSLESYLTKQNRYTSLQAQALAARGKWPTTAKLVLSPLLRFIKFYGVRGGFLDGWQGFVHITIGCFNSFVKYAKTREAMRKGRDT